MNRKTPVFLILAHSHIELIKRLVETLAHYQGEIALYFANTDPEEKRKLSEALKNSRVHLLENTQHCYWGSSKITWAMIELLKYGVKNFKNQGHYHFLSAQCFPTKSPQDFHDFFDKNPHKSFIRTLPLSHEASKIQKYRLEAVEYLHLNKYFDCRSSKLSHRFIRKIDHLSLKFQKAFSIKRNIPEKIKSFHRGSQWLSLSHEAAPWILDFIAREPETLDFFDYCLLSDEIFFQTLMFLSPFNTPEKLSDNSLRFIDWNYKDNAILPRLLVPEEHLASIRASDVFFTRKLDPHNHSLANILLKDIGLAPK